MKTTSKHFLIFKQEYEKWIEIYGLKDGEIVFAHSDEKVGEGNTAHCNRNYFNRIARLSLCETWPDDSMAELSDENVRLAAFEETCHPFLYILSACAYARFIMEDEIGAAEHAIIRTLQNVLYPKY